MSDVKKLYSFDFELKTIKEMYPDFSDTKAEKFTYEKIITNKALENTLNPYHMFMDPKESFAVKFNNIINKYKTDLQGNYSIINKIKNEPNAAKTMFNLYVAEKDFTNDKSNLYHKNLLDLANPGIKKVDNDAENIMISDFFSKLPFYAFMQTGINKTKFNFTNIVQYNDFMNLVNDESKKLINALEDNNVANKFLDMLYSRFIRENNKAKLNKGRFQNYLLDFDLDDLASIKKENITDSELSTDDEENLKRTVREGLIETKNPNVFLLDDTGFFPNNYNNILSKNTDVTFVYPTSIAILQNNAQATGKSVIKNIALEMSIGLPVAQNNMTDNMKDLPSNYYENIINYYNEQFKFINTLIKDGLPVTFLTSGYGNVTEMPKELFIHLSKELYKQPIGFLNPGSTMYKDMQKLVKNRQGISDQEILDNFGLEEDPFTCKI